MSARQREAKEIEFHGKRGIKLERKPLSRKERELISDANKCKPYVKNSDLGGVLDEFAAVVVTELEGVKTGERGSSQSYALWNPLRYLKRIVGNGSVDRWGAAPAVPLSVQPRLTTLYHPRMKLPDYEQVCIDVLINPGLAAIVNYSLISDVQATRYENKVNDKDKVKALLKVAEAKLDWLKRT